MWKGSCRQCYALCIHSICMKCNFCHSCKPIIWGQYFRPSERKRKRDTSKSYTFYSTQWNISCHREEHQMQGHVRSIKKRNEARLEGQTGRCPALMRSKFLLPSTCNAGSCFICHLLCSLEKIFFCASPSMVDCQENYGQDVRDRKSSKLSIIHRDILRFHLRLANIWQLQIKTWKVKLVNLIKSSFHRFPDAAIAFLLRWTVSLKALESHASSDCLSSLDVAITAGPAAAAAQAGKRQCLPRQRRGGPGWSAQPQVAI